MVLCTIVNTKGSVPRHAGTKMLVYSEGHLKERLAGVRWKIGFFFEAMAAFKDGKPAY